MQSCFLPPASCIPHPHRPMPRITVPEFTGFKAAGRKISMVTAYDYRAWPGWSTRPASKAFWSATACRWSCRATTARCP